MKRFLISFAVAAAVGVMLPASAQTTANPAAKVDPKNNKVGKPVVEKPKEKLMTRDELRICMKSNQANDAEARAIKAIEAGYNDEHAKLLAEKPLLSKRSEELVATVTQIKQDREELIKFGEDIKARGPKLEKDELKKLQDEYQARAAAMEPRIEAANKAKDAYVVDSKAFDTRIEAHNKVRDDVSARIDKHMDAADDWKASCANKKYDEADEIAIKKELAATAK
jgi:hypothetical protein